jgi:transposase
VILPLLDAWRDIRKRAANLDHQLLTASRQSRATKLLMTIPGVGAVTAVSYIAAIEDPENFPTSRSVGAWLGLTTRRCQSVKSTMMAISHDAATVGCGDYFTRQQPSS